MRDTLVRLYGSVALGVALVVQRLRRTAPRRVVYSVLGVALAVGLFVTVSGVGVGLATQGSAVGSNVDYWIVPESESSSTLPVSVGGPKFGDVHAVADRLTAREDVRYASPVAISLARVTHGNATEYVLLAGVVAHPELTVAGVSARSLTPGDPHYANGTYAGPWTDEVVLSSAASELLGAEAGETVAVPNRTGSASGTHAFTVENVTAGGQSGIGQVPVAVVHLAELQALTGSTAGDTADQILVASNDVGVREDLAGVYSHSRVVARSDASLSTVADSRLALALGGAGFAVSLVVGVLFVATTMGLEIRSDRRLWATLTALGFSARSRALVLFAQTAAVALAGGVLGVALGRVGVLAANAGVGAYLEETTVAVFPLELAAAGLVVSLGIAALSAPYLLWLTSRGTVTEALTT